MIRTYALLGSLAALGVGCATPNKEPVTATSTTTSQSAAYQPPAAKNEIVFDAKCAGSSPPIESVAPENRKNVVPPRFDPRHGPFPTPTYPAYSLQTGQEGAPEVAALVTETGMIERTKLKGTSGYVELDNAALESVRTYRFIPARVGEDPVCMWVTFRLVFKLDTPASP